jgi:hypothetical protein
MMACFARHDHGNQQQLIMNQILNGVYPERSRRVQDDNPLECHSERERRIFLI